MTPISATYINNEIEPGWTLLEDDTPLGKRYLVDYDSICEMILTDKETGKEVRLKGIYVLEPGTGYLPLCVLRLEIG